MVVDKLSPQGLFIWEAVVELSIPSTMMELAQFNEADCGM